MEKGRPWEESYVAVAVATGKFISLKISVLLVEHANLCQTLIANRTFNIFYAGFTTTLLMPLCTLILSVALK